MQTSQAASGLSTLVNQVFKERKRRSSFFGGHNLGQIDGLIPPSMGLNQTVVPGYVEVGADRLRVKQGSLHRSTITTTRRRGSSSATFLPAVPGIEQDQSPNQPHL